MIKQGQLTFTQCEVILDYFCPLKELMNNLKIFRFVFIQIFYINIV